MTLQRFLSSIGCAAVGVAACAHVDMLRVDPAPRSPKSPDSVAVLAQEPDRPYVVIALVIATAELFASPNALKNRLIHRAAKLGGDAVLLGGESLGRKKDGGASLSGRVIVFRPDPGDSAAPGIHDRLTAIDRAAIYSAVLDSATSLVSRALGSQGLVTFILDPLIRERGRHDGLTRRHDSEWLAAQMRRENVLGSCRLFDGTTYCDNGEATVAATLSFIYDGGDRLALVELRAARRGGSATGRRGAFGAVWLVRLRKTRSQWVVVECRLTAIT